MESSALELGATSKTVDSSMAQLLTEVLGWTDVLGVGLGVYSYLVHRIVDGLFSIGCIQVYRLPAQRMIWRIHFCFAAAVHVTMVLGWTDVLGVGLGVYSCLVHCIVGGAGSVFIPGALYSDGLSGKVAAFRCRK